MTCAAVSWVTKPGPVRIGVAATGQQPVLRELGHDLHAQVALEVLLLVDREEHVAVVDRVQHVLATGRTSRSATVP